MPRMTNECEKGNWLVLPHYKSAGSAHNPGENKQRDYASKVLKPVYHIYVTAGDMELMFYSVSNQVNSLLANV